MNKLAVLLTLGVLFSFSGLLLVHAIGEYGSSCGTIHGCLNLTVVVNSTNRNATANWTIFSTDNVSTNFYIQPSTLATEGASNSTTVFNERYNYTANSSNPTRIVLNISNNGSVTARWEATYYFTYFNSTLNKTVQVSSANFNGSENYPEIAFNKTSGYLKSGEGTSILTEATLPMSNNPLYNSLINGNMVNASIAVSINPVAPVIQYIPETGTLSPNANYTIMVVATLPENMSLYHVWYSKTLATALPLHSNNTQGGAVIDVGTAKNLYVKGVTTSTIIPTTIAQISSNSSAKSQSGQAKSGSTAGIAAIAAIVVIVIAALVFMSYNKTKARSSKRRRR